MATVPETSSEENPTLSHSNSISHSPQTLDQLATPWVDYAVEQARIYQKNVEETFESAIAASRSRLSEIRATSAAHFSQTINSLEDIKSNCGAYEELLFGKIKEGVHVAASNPMITAGVATGLGFLLLKRPRRLLYHKALRLFVSEESLLSRADAKVKELRHSIDLLKAESEKLEKRALHAEEELTRGRTKLRQTGKQIQSVIRSAYKAERQAAGLKDILGELPRREAAVFRSQVSKLATEAKKERNALSKEVTKISNYGISV
ncbi:RGS1-HXK1-interacting protein 1 [Pyrus communis]|uniref:RGS1-HXK1-interacting protein 1 n=1 Tax=Pyrus communis TaxID=23211 RepID=UPI0035C20079